MGGVDVNQATLIAGVLAGMVVANAAAIVGAYVSIKVSIAKLEVKVDILSKDTDALGENFRDLKKQKKEN